ncbi:MAG: hypothetical protein IJV41_11145 [Oscillospiraceae bacterium]|nr:hypothetical protein [Oscillospiraceae bacterium]
MTAILNILAFLSLTAFLALLFEDELVQLLPVAASLLILTLYVLAFFRWLWLIDALCVVAILACAWGFWRRCGKDALRCFVRIVCSPRAVAVYLMLFLAWFLFRRTLISASDDLGCWALEAKSIWYYGGFAPRYQNAAVSYGNYFPGATLFRWWVCHLAPTFREGLLAVGSAWLFVILLAPILSCFRFGLVLSPVVAVLGGGFLLLLPGVYDYMTYLSISAEPLISAAFAGAWITLFSRNRRAGKAQLAAYGFLMMFFKATGILYAASILIFFCLVRKAADDSAGTDSLLTALRPAGTWLAALCAAIPTAVWVLYCVLMGRSSYFTVSTGAAGETVGTWNAYVLPYLRSFLAALVSVPAHNTHDGILDLPLVCLLLITVALGCAAVRLGRLPVRSGRWLGIYFAGMLIAFFAGLLLMHCFVFRETQYFEPENMILSCSRYGQPLSLGALLFLFQRYASGRPNWARRISLGVFFLLALSCTCLWTVYYRVVNNSGLVEQTLAARQYVAAKNEAFLSACDGAPVGRYLYVYGDSFELPGQERACLQFLSAPNSLVFFEADAEANDWDAQAAELDRLIAAVHPDGVFFTGLDADVSTGELKQNVLLPVTGER